jgi:hypothetical protein
MIDGVDGAAESLLIESQGGMGAGLRFAVSSVAAYVRFASAVLSAARSLRRQREQWAEPRAVREAAVMLFTVQHSLWYCLEPLLQEA